MVKENIFNKFSSLNVWNSSSITLQTGFYSGGKYLTDFLGITAKVGLDNFKQIEPCVES